MEKVQIQTQGEGKDYSETFTHEDPDILATALSRRSRELDRKGVRFSVSYESGSVTIQFDASDMTEWG